MLVRLPVKRPGQVGKHADIARVAFEIGNEFNEQVCGLSGTIQALSGTGLIGEIRQTADGNFVIGSERFQKQVENELGRRVTRGKPGRSLADIR